MHLFEAGAGASFVAEVNALRDTSRSLSPEDVNSSTVIAPLISALLDSLAQLSDSCLLAVPEDLQPPERKQPPPNPGLPVAEQYVPDNTFLVEEQQEHQTTDTAFVPVEQQGIVDPTLAQQLGGPTLQQVDTASAPVADRGNADFLPTPEQQPNAHLAHSHDFRAPNPLTRVDPASDSETEDQGTFLSCFRL